MAKRKVVSFQVDEKFFSIFENARKKEQTKLRMSLGGMFNLSQRNFTSMLAKQSFNFSLPKQKFKQKLIRRKRI